MFKISDIIEINGSDLYTVFADYDSKPWELIKNLDIILSELNISGTNYRENYEHCIDEDNTNIFIGEGTTLESGANIKNNVIIGKNCRIKGGAAIGPNVFIMDECTIGHCSEVENSIFMSNSNAAHLNFVGHSIIGSNVNLAAGVICSNFKQLPFGADINIQVNGRKINTKMSLLGSFIGDYTKIGCNSVLNPGTIISKRVIVYPGNILRGYIDTSVIIKGADKHSVRIEESTV